MRITKRQLRRIIKEERARLLKEQEQEVAVNSTQHHYPSADSGISNVAGELAEGWHEMELKSWSAGDPSMNKQGELSDPESKEYWGEQVEAATDALDEELKERLRLVALEVMEEYTGKLINGDYS